MSRLFSVPSFRFGMTPKVGAWNRIATFGTKTKDGEEISFNAETLGQMVENWSKRGYKLAMCLDHESATPGRAPAAAFIDALAVFTEGRCIKFASVGGDAEKPSAEGRDGLYGRLSEITPLGKDEKEGLANYAGLSPFFTIDGKSETGDPVGYEIFDVAAVNVPFQAGCALQFHRDGVSTVLGYGNKDDKEVTGAPPNPGYGEGDCDGSGKKATETYGSMITARLAVPDLVKKTSKSNHAAKAFNQGAPMPLSTEQMTRLGLSDGATPEEMSAAFAKYMDDAEEKQKVSLAEAETKEKDAEVEMDVDPSNAEQNAAIHVKTGNVHDEGGRKASRFSDDGDENTTLSALAVKFGLGKSATRKEILMALAATPSPSAMESQINNLVDARFAAEKAAQAQVDAKSRAETMASEAVQGGYAESDKSALIAFAQTNFAAAEKLAGPYLAKSRSLFGRVTNGGAPVGQSRPGEAPPHDNSGVIKMGRGLAHAIALHRRENPKASYEEAALVVARKNPELAELYFNGQ